MTNEEIKVEVDRIQNCIQQDRDRLQVLISRCTHDKTRTVNWSYRIGVFDKAVVCHYCGNFIKFSE